MSGDSAIRFWSKVDKNGPVHPVLKTPCWLWTASTERHGYGKFFRDGRLHRAHRVSWELAHGFIPDGEGFHGTCVLHRCDTPACVNPAHLFLGTHLDNVADCIAKGRKAENQCASLTRCRRGHLFDVTYANGSRGCRRCDSEKSRRYRQRLDESGHQRRRDYQNQWRRDHIEHARAKDRARGARRRSQRKQAAA